VKTFGGDARNISSLTTLCRNTDRSLLLVEMISFRLWSTC
jgi:hypothetical protein